MTASPKSYQALLNKLGKITNELLIFAVIAAILINLIAAPLSFSEKEWKEIVGVSLHVLTALMLIATLMFHIYARYYLPTNQQQLAFATDVTKSVKDHKRKLTQRHRDYNSLKGYADNDGS